MYIDMYIFFQMYLQFDSVTLKVTFSYVYVFKELIKRL